MIQLRDLQPDPPDVSRGRPIVSGRSCDESSTLEDVQFQYLGLLSYANEHRKFKVDGKTTDNA